MLTRSENVPGRIGHNAARARRALHRAESAADPAASKIAMNEWFGALRIVASLPAFSAQDRALKLALAVAESAMTGPTVDNSNMCKFVLLASALADAVLEAAEHDAAPSRSCSGP